MDFTAKSYTLKLDESGAEQLNDLIEENNLSPNSFKDLFYDLLKLATTPKEAPEPITEIKEVEVIKEVSAPLKPNQVLIDCSEKQLNYLEQIRNNRIAYAKEYRKEQTEEPNEVLIKKMVFKREINN